MVPAMVVGFGIPAAVAKGTSLAVIIPTSIMGTLRNRSNSNVDLRLAAVVGIAGVVSAYLGVEDLRRPRRDDVEPAVRRVAERCGVADDVAAGPLPRRRLNDIYRRRCGASARVSGTASSNPASTPISRAVSTAAIAGDVLMPAPP